MNSHVLQKRTGRGFVKPARYAVWRLGIAQAARGISAVLFASALSTFPTGVATAQPAAQHAARQAFTFGADYGNGIQLYYRSPRMTAAIRAAVEDYMRDAADSAKQLGVSFDPNLPAVDLTQPNPGVAVVGIATDRANSIRVAIDARWGTRAAAAFQLGYRAMMATEFVPLIPPESQARELRVLRQLGAEAGVPTGILEPYLNQLLARDDRKAVVLASFDFRRQVLAQFDAAAPLTPDQARRMLNVWLAGTRVSLAALGQTHGADQGTVQRLFAEARERARAFDVQIPSLPIAESKDPRNLARTLHYLMNEVGDRVGDDLARRHGDRYRALFNLAVKSMIATILYGPETGEGDMTPALISTIEGSAKTALLPPDIWHTLVQKMKARAPYVEVKAEITRMHANCEDYYRRLANP